MTAPAPNPIQAPGTGEQAWRTWAGLGQLPALGIDGWASAAIVAAHPDDEVLGAGGIIAVLAAAGARLRLVSVTDGEASHPGAGDPRALAQRRVAETAQALRALGAQHTEVIRLRLPDTGLASHEAELTTRLADLTAGFGVCLAPWHRDVHADHEVAGRSARRATGRTLCYPVWMWHWAVPGDLRVPWHRALRVPLPAAVAAAKRAAIGCFASQLEDRGAGLGPVLAPGTVAHFSRDQEVLFR
ncbi:MAG TPA: PIG-L family deacetylase [Streptosporangiaceae bacterium]|nr:PIG-L family deacetylase [Streptosporangiaceae bacterium]